MLVWSNRRLRRIGCFAALSTLPSLVAAQGGRVGEDLMPVSSMPPMARRALEAANMHWRKRVTARAELYILIGSAAESALKSVAEDADQAIADNVAWLGVKDTAPKFRLFFVGSREEMRQISGEPRGGGAFTDEGTAFFVATDSIRPALRHETMHLLSWRLWGLPAATWLSEGLATASVGRCRGQSAEDVVATMDRAHALVSLDALRHDFVFTGETGAVYYYESASLVRYIDRVYGRVRLRDFWSHGGVARAPQTLGVDAATLEREWRASVSRVEPRTTWVALWGDIQAHGCE